MNPFLVNLLCGVALGGLALTSMLMLLRSLRIQQAKDPKSVRENLIGVLKKYVIPVDVILLSLVGFFYIGPMAANGLGAQ